MNTSIDTAAITAAAKATIVAFHVGRGGRFYNAGHVTFIGQRKISEFTHDLFISYENYYQISKQIAGRENLSALLEKAFEGDTAATNRLSGWGFELGEEIYTNGNGDPVGLTVEEAETGVGTINIDNQYDTTSACYLSDCDDRNFKLIKDSNEFNYMSDECQTYVLWMLGEFDEENENED
jgi:hypothetical protein